VITEPSADLSVWLDGEFVPYAEARVHVTAHHYGVGVFEGVRAYRARRGVALFRLREHTARLFRSSKILGIPLPWSAEQLNEAQCQLTSKNDLGDAYLRPFVFYDGASGIGLHTNRLVVRTAIVALPWNDDGAHLDPEGAARGVRIRTSSFMRHHPAALLSKAKANAHYMNSILALAEARDSGADDALLLDHEGFVTEASGANVFVVQGRELHTPPRESVLDGITRDTVFTLAADLGLTVRERRMTRDELYSADEVFLTGTAAEITPVRSVDGRMLPSTAVTGRLRATYLEHTRGLAGRDEWLTYIGTM
jgi:branched-chain amino acid aminotransferase